MSDFLQFKDEVINGTPRYNISDNGDGTKSIELANEVVQNGTSLSKSGFNKLNTILGYNECDYSQSSITEEVNFLVNFQQVSSTNISLNTTIKKIGEIDINGSIATINADVNTNDYGGSTIYYDPRGNIFTYKEDLSNAWANMGIYGWTQNRFYFDKNISVKKLSIYSSTSIKVQLYNNDELLYDTGVFTSNKIIELGQYYSFNKIIVAGYSNGNGTVFITLQDTKATITTYTNHITSGNYSNFENGQIVNIQTPVLPSQSVVANTFNGEQVDTLLQSNKYYELLYDKPNDRFIAHEERV